MGKYLDLVSIDPVHIIITIINLMILFFIFKKYLFKPVQAIFDKRKQEIDNIYSEAQSAHDAAEKDRTEYEEKISTADAQADQIIKEASEKAGRLSENIIKDANAKAGALMKKADEDIARERKKAVNDIKNEISSISVDIAQKVIEREINEDDQKDLIDSFIDEIGDAND
ncbi:MAG: F0F1 ATP synthase subunit B [Clostridia bacterium]|nr:F0F1 ATP synthase subunit B [Clostridia bacterium]